MARSLITTLASSSAANCTVIDDGEAQILLDAGLMVKDLRVALNFKLQHVTVALVTHSHGDHSRGVPGLLKAGVRCRMLPETANALGVAEHHGVLMVAPLTPFQAGAWIVTALPMKHDVPIVAFVLDNKAKGIRIAYITDTAYSEYRIPGVTHWLLECNFAESILRERVMMGSLDPQQAYRVRRTHLGLERAVELLLANDRARLVEVHATHLSSGNSSADLVKRTLQAATGVPVYIAAERTRA